LKIFQIDSNNFNVNLVKAIVLKESNLTFPSNVPALVVLSGTKLIVKYSLQYNDYFQCFDIDGNVIWSEKLVLV
jgi:hypothetical protein